MNHVILYVARLSLFQVVDLNVSLGFILSFEAC